MKKKCFLFIIISLFITGCSNDTINYNLKLDYVTEKNKFEIYLMDSEFTKQDDSYYLGLGFECDVDSEYAKKYETDGMTLYHCINSEKEREQNYYQITPSTMSLKYFSNLSIANLSENEYSASKAYYDIKKTNMFQLEYKIENNSISGYYQINSGSTLEKTYTLNYNYTTDAYTCFVGEKDNYYQDEECSAYDTDFFKKTADELKNKMDKILSESSINIEKVKEYLISVNIESNN